MLGFAHVRLLATADALAAAGLAVELVELGPLAVAGVGDDQDRGVVAT